MDRICYKCVDESFLSNDIRNAGQQNVCTYCQRKNRSIDLETFADRIELAFTQHYIRTEDSPDLYQSIMIRDKESNYDWERSGESVIDAIENAAHICTKAAADIQALLEHRHSDFDDPSETEFSNDTYYEECTVDDTVWRQQWQLLEHSLRCENRYFNAQVSDTLETLFSDINQVGTSSGKRALITIGPKTDCLSAYRARAFHQDSDIEKALTNPEKELGPPPPQIAKPGRMNAMGISAFYGATESETAIAEIRPSVGSTVLTALFTFTRTLTLLDLDVLAATIETGSIFDPTFSERLERHAFLRGLQQILITPVSPVGDNLNYLVTQAIADFLAAHKIGIDGIRYRSTQVAKRSTNVVLFHKSSRVKNTLGKGDRTAYRIEDDHENPDSGYRYYVTTKSNCINRSEDSLGNQLLDNQSEEHREHSLAIDLSSITIHRIGGVKFDIHSYKLE